MLLVDMRRCFLGSRQPLTRMEMDSDSNATLTVILTDRARISCLAANFVEQIDGISGAPS